jgi:CheY-like chemotaxis protein
MKAEGEHKIERRTGELTGGGGGAPIARVLFMDDEELVRDAVPRLLDAYGYEVQCAVNGEEALEIYQKAYVSGRPFDVVIMDLTIEDGMGAQETVGELLKLDPAARVIVASGYSGDPTLSNFREHGFAGMLPKPFTSEELRKSIEDALKT